MKAFRRSEDVMLLSPKKASFIRTHMSRKPWKL